VTSGSAGPPDESVRRLRKVPLSNPERRREVLEAALALLSEMGYERLTMDLVAQRAKASKATLYQRWPSKAQLVVDAFAEHRPRIVDADRGSLAEDLRQLLTCWLAGWSGYDRGLAIALLEGSRSDPDLARLRRERLGRPMREAAEAVLARARARGEIPAGVDAELLLEMPFALVLMHVLVLDEVPGRDLVERIVEGAVVPVLRGAGPGRPGAGPASTLA
jgi:AcrR family transcriptional regulator